MHCWQKRTMRRVTGGERGGAQKLERGGGRTVSVAAAVPGRGVEGDHQPHRFWDQPSCLPPHTSPLTQRVARAALHFPTTSTRLTRARMSGSGVANWEPMLSAVPGAARRARFAPALTVERVPLRRSAPLALPGRARRHALPAVWSLRPSRSSRPRSSVCKFPAVTSDWRPARPPSSP